MVTHVIIPGCLIFLIRGWGGGGWKGGLWAVYKRAVLAVISWLLIALF